MKAMKARIPLTQKWKVQKITYTKIDDVGRFVIATCDLPFEQWREDFGMIESSIVMDKAVEIIEGVKGMKMQVEYRSVEDVKERKRMSIKTKFKCFDWNRRRFIQKIMCMNGILDQFWTRVELCADVKTLGVKEHVSRFWGRNEVVMVNRRLMNWVTVHRLKTRQSSTNRKCNRMSLVRSDGG